jgi:hypothetical protein
MVLGKVHWSLVLFILCLILNMYLKKILNRFSGHSTVLFVYLSRSHLM